MDSAEGVVEDGATVGAGCEIGPGAVVEDGAVLGSGVRIGRGALILSGTRLADGVEVGPYSILGKQPRAASSSTREVGPADSLVIGRESIIGSWCVIYAGSVFGDKCYVGDQAGIREACVFADAVLIGRMVAVESNVRVGARSRVMTGAYITGETTLGEDVFVGPMAITTNDRRLSLSAAAELKGPTI